jgi:hypothetical protein
MSHTAADTVPEDVDDQDAGDLLDEEWLSGTPRRSRVRLVLLGALVLSATFFGGVEVQRHFGTADSAGTTAGGLPAGLPSGFPGGGFPGGVTPGDTTTGTGQADGGGTDTGSAGTSQVIGTLVAVRGDTWTVKDLGGTKHTITVDARTRVVRETEVDPGDVPTGSTVDIAGEAGGSGDVTATTITIR